MNGNILFKLKPKDIVRTLLTTTGKPYLNELDTLAEAKINNGNPTICIVGNNAVLRSYSDLKERNDASKPFMKHSYKPFLKLFPQGMSSECYRDVM